MVVECGVYMIERRTLEDVLNDLKEAEKEYKEKCLMYGITEKRKRKKDGEEEEELLEGENIENEETGENAELPNETPIEEITENTEEISEN